MKFSYHVLSVVTRMLLASPDFFSKRWNFWANYKARTKDVKYRKEKKTVIHRLICQNSSAFGLLDLPRKTLNRRRRSSCCFVVVVEIYIVFLTFVENVSSSCYLKNWMYFLITYVRFLPFFLCFWHFIYLFKFCFGYFARVCMPKTCWDNNRFDVLSQLIFHVELEKNCFVPLVYSLLLFDKLCISKAL